MAHALEPLLQTVAVNPDRAADRLQPDRRAISGTTIPHASGPDRAAADPDHRPGPTCGPTDAPTALDEFKQSLGCAGHARRGAASQPSVRDAGRIEIGAEAGTDPSPALSRLHFILAADDHSPAAGE